MTNNMPDYSNLINTLKLQSGKTFIDYIKSTAPILADFVVYYLKYETNMYENCKHKDVVAYLYDPIIKYSKNYGKLHRPLTCIAAYLACSNENYDSLAQMLPVACAIEHFQTAALIHDDIADGGQIRRSKPCLHKIYGDGLAINVGDFGLCTTIASVLHQMNYSQYSDSKILEIVKQLIFMEYMTIEGQAVDLGWAKNNRFDITEKDYICMATKKSAYYSAAVPCVLGAICADMEERVILALKTFGKNVGLAFQIRDDLLNLIDAGANTKDKDFRTDITEGKRTLCTVKALELASKKSSQRLYEILKLSTNNKNILEEAVCIMQDCGALDYADKFATNLCEEARIVITNTLPKCQWTNILIDMANWAKSRDL